MHVSQITLLTIILTHFVTCKKQCGPLTDYLPLWPEYADEFDTPAVDSECSFKDVLLHFCFVVV